MNKSCFVDVQTDFFVLFFTAIVTGFLVVFLAVFADDFLTVFVSDFLVTFADFDFSEDFALPLLKNAFLAKQR